MSNNKSGGRRRYLPNPTAAAAEHIENRPAPRIPVGRRYCIASRMSMKYLFSACLALSLLFSATAHAEPIVIKFSHVVAEDTPKGRGALLFQRLVPPLRVVKYAGMPGLT